MINSASLFHLLFGDNTKTERWMGKVRRRKRWMKTAESKIKQVRVDMKASQEKLQS